MREIDSGSVAVDTSSTALITLDALGTFTRMGLDVSNASGGDALNAFKIEVRYHNGGEYHLWLEDSDFDSTTLDALLTCTDTGPHEVGADASAGFSVELGAFESIKISATSAGSSTVRARGWLV